MALGDRCNMVFLGTAITYRRGLGVVTATGMEAELGHIATMIQSVESERTPLQQRMAQMGNALAIRSDKYSLFSIGVLSDLALVGAVRL